MKKILVPLLLLYFLESLAQTAPGNIRLNQVGFLPEAQKIAVVVGSSQSAFEVIKNSNSAVVFSGTLSASKYWSKSEEDVKIADFSDFKTRGTYRLKLGNGDLSHPFKIADDVLLDLTSATIKAYYYNRASMELTEEFAGVYNRPLGHPDNAVVVLPSAASDERPAGTVISTPKGWYDAGDYNKYIVNSGISTFTLLAAYENYPEFYDTLDLNIPESGNALPDLLDEALWNIEWMSTMQDPNDGGVYNKTTTANFQGVVMPHKATATRYVVAKGTAAALDFAAVMAMAYRIYKPYLPDFADECLAKAELAWTWAKTNPNVSYNNPGAQDGYPAVHTGGYGDGNFSDEFFWAAVELYIGTKDDSYFSTLNFSQYFGIPGWPNVQTLGILSLITHRKSLTAAADTTAIKNILINMTDDIKDYQKNTSPYLIPNNDFYWGSNSIPGNQGMLLMYAYELTNDVDYLNAAIGAVDYLLGRNATKYCFVTGFGTVSPIDIHHRQSGADNVAAPVPGFLAGGPNPQNVNDDCGASKYPSLVAAQCYVDDFCSYSTNEITINWNAPLVYTAGAIHAVYDRDFKTPNTDPVEEPLSLFPSFKVEIYPNPADDFLIVQTDEHTFGEMDIRIFSINGKEVISTTQSRIDVSALTQGVYVVRCKTRQQTISRQILIR
ncbi:glycoside hydrolase family 9 protein [Marinoscillum luteum]|uniref:Endoglucanase n=1 Tax=Marinoscillum luteum TaxID=861051 RepID=A0ABW7NAF5_9BACT